LIVVSPEGNVCGATLLADGGATTIKSTIDLEVAEKGQALAQAEQGVPLGHWHIVKQEAIVKELAEDGHDSTLAKELLATFKDGNTLHEQHRDVVVEEVDALQSTEDQ
jgi:hypothetical protein